MNKKVLLNELVIDGTVDRESAVKIVAAAQKGESFLILRHSDN